MQDDEYVPNVHGGSSYSWHAGMTRTGPKREACPMVNVQSVKVGSGTGRLLSLVQAAEIIIQYITTLETASTTHRSQCAAALGGTGGALSITAPPPPVAGVTVFDRISFISFSAISRSRFSSWSSRSRRASRLTICGW